MLAACGLAEVDVVRRPKVAVLSTGDELVRARRAAQAGRASTTATARSSRRPSRRPAASRCAFGAFPDDEVALELAVRRALDACDMVVLSGGTSKGAGDLSHRVVSRLGTPGILVHGVALKPGKPLCLGVIGGKPIVVLPGFPTSAIFTFHAFVAPVIRARAGLPPEAARNHRGARCRCASPPSSAARNSCWCRWSKASDGAGRVPDRQRLRRGDELLAGRRLPRDRRAGVRRSMPARRRSVTLIGSRRARARPRHHGQPRRRARRRGRRAGRARLYRAHASRSAASAASRRPSAANATSRRCI